MRRKLVGAIAVLGAVVALLLTGLIGDASADASRAGEGSHGPRPVIFVHGFAGSGAQFESHAQRLTSNGYPSNRIAVLEYDSTFGVKPMDQVWVDLDHLIDRLLDETGADKVDLLGHSLGTGVSQGYLTSSPERAARVAHYVNIDGATAGSLPGGVPTLAVWGEGAQTRTITGATNVYFPDQSHVQVSTSAETFEQFYTFFTGREPRTTDVVPEMPGRVSLSGRAIAFLSNTGMEGATLQIWPVAARTGQRLVRAPQATYHIGADGNWGPFRANGNQHYEMALVSEDGSQTHHFYFQPFFRSDHLVRLLTQEPGTGLDMLRDKSDRHSTLTIVRYKEFWGDQGDQNDVLKVNGQSLLSAAVAPRSKRLNALFVVDDGSDGVSHLDMPIADMASLPFISGVDLFVPAATPPSGTVRVEQTARAADGSTEVINVPNWASSSNHISVQFRDYEQRVERFGVPRHH
jgi:pimeloyl-ACP methyl ester carboxylesterase